MNGVDTSVLARFVLADDPDQHRRSVAALEADDDFYHSRILKGNPLGDPRVRKRGVGLPPGYDDGGYGSIIHGMKYAKYWGAIAQCPPESGALVAGCCQI